MERKIKSKRKGSNQWWEKDLQKYQRWSSKAEYFFQLQNPQSSEAWTSNRIQRDSTKKHPFRNKPNGTKKTESIALSRLGLNELNAMKNGSIGKRKSKGSRGVRVFRIEGCRKSKKTPFTFVLYLLRWFFRFSVFPYVACL